MTKKTMKAVYYEQYGGPEVLEILDVPVPTPNADEVLIKVEATHICNGDQLARIGNSPWPLMRYPAKLMMGVFKPKHNILGGEFSGVVESVGNAVTQYKAGDRVFGFTDMQFGAQAEFVCLPETAPITHCPDDVELETAAAIGGSNSQTALHFINVANIQPGDEVLVNGASGGIGRVAVQLAKHLGANVTGTCSVQNMDLVKQLGADTVFDYRATDFTKQRKQYDVIIDCAGFLPWHKVEPVLKAKGRHLLAMFGFSHLWKQRQTKGKGGKQQLCVLAPGSKEKITKIGQLLSEGSLKPIITNRFAMSDAIEAAKLYDTNTQAGSIILLPQQWKNS